MTKPLMIDLYCGLGGWASGGLAEGYDVYGFDIERHVYGEHRYPAQLVVQDVLSLHGSQFRGADLIVASPPCQEYSYMAMPWSRAKAKATAIREDQSGQAMADLTRLFDACFRIQREACDTAGRHIPMIVENVRWAQPWVGRARCHVGSFYFWGDVPALMPIIFPRKQLGDASWFYDNYENSARRFGSKSKERKQWSAEIAKIPTEVSTWISRCFKPISSPALLPESATSELPLAGSKNDGPNIFTMPEAGAQI